MAKQADLLAVEEARERILARFGLLGGESVPLTEALGRVLAGAVTSESYLPPFTNSSMDGFAVCSSSTAGASPERPLTLKVSAHIAAGESLPQSISTDDCARIMTGAPMPQGADAVVPFENVQDNGTSITLVDPIASKACVRPAGQDVRPSDRLLGLGAIINPAGVALLAALGMDSVRVIRKPVVAILSTGSELVPPGQALAPGQIHNSNAFMLAAAIEDAGGSVGANITVDDDRSSISAALDQMEGADLLLTSGGASVGDFDYVKSVLGESGTLDFWRVRVRPGKPLIFGEIAGTPLIGLPGNPTSAMVTFELFARPAIRTMLGASSARPRILAICDDTVENQGGRRTFARIRLLVRDGRFHATLAGPQDSAMLAPLARADGLLEISEDTTEIRAGETGVVHVWSLPGSD